MLALLIAVAVLSVLWLALWRSQPLMAFGVFIGLPIGWLAYRTFSPYFTGDMDDIPVWLPPLPVVTIALALIVYGAIVWFRGEKLGREKKQD